MMFSKFKDEHPAFILASTGQTITYNRLQKDIADCARKIRRTTDRTFLFMESDGSYLAIVHYLALLEIGYPTCLVEKVSDQMLTAYNYPPVITNRAEFSPENYIPKKLTGDFFLASQGSLIPAHPDLAICLTTSGSTGSPKLVKLTKKNLKSNADSINQYLGITRHDISIQSLPMYYSYGLSLINSHLAAGGTTVLTEHSFFTRQFWHDVDKYLCSSFAGVPYMYDTLHRLKFEPASHPSLRTLTVAGGSLAPFMVKKLYQQTSAAGQKFFVMYGQTEATARIAYVPPEKLGEKIGSIGIAIPGGKLSLQPTELGDELIYSGDNVMMGYASSVEDLSANDQLRGVLRTKDLARVDSEGYFYFLGRSDHSVKLYGKRVNLIDVQYHLQEKLNRSVAVISDDKPDSIKIFVEDGRPKPEAEMQVKRAAQNYLKMPVSTFIVKFIKKLPLTNSNKINYKAL